MSATPATPRYETAQIVEAIGRARGDGRYFLVTALLDLVELHELTSKQREHALEQVLAKELGADERRMVVTALARLQPATYLTTLIQTGLRSRSINVQQVTLADLPDLVDEGLATELGEQVERWLRHRLANPRRGGTWAPWEIPSVALALLPSYGADRIEALLTDVEPTMQPDEQDAWLSLKQAVADREALEQGLKEWAGRDGSDWGEPDLRDPTAEVSVDRVMKRLGYSPANPQNRVYDALADSEIPTFVFDGGD